MTSDGRPEKTLPVENSYLRGETVGTPAYRSYGTGLTTAVGTDQYTDNISIQIASAGSPESYTPSNTYAIVSGGSGGRKAARRIAPQVYFRFIKKHFRPLERRVLRRRLTLLQQAFDAAVEAGQDVLAEKFMSDFVVKVREAKMATKGIRLFIHHDVLVKHKHEIRGGHISDTLLREYTRVIPKAVLKKKQKVATVFDDFVVFHYWSDQPAADVGRMSEEEKAKMRDPVLFGIIKETNRLYFVADWADEHCDLSFEELTKVVAKGTL